MYSPSTNATFEQMLCNWKYFGTYLGYLPMIPTSPQCDTFQLIPVGFQPLGFLRTFHLIIYSEISIIQLSFFLESSQSLIRDSQNQSCTGRMNFSLVKITFQLQNKLIDFNLAELLRPTHQPNQLRFRGRPKPTILVTKLLSKDNIIAIMAGGGPLQSKQTLRLIVPLWNV